MSITGRLACVCGSTDVEWRQGTHGNPYWACNVCEPIGEVTAPTSFTCEGWEAYNAEQAD